MDIFERIAKDAGGPLGQYREKSQGYFMFPKLEGELGPHMTFQGQPVLNWSLNNYLGLANHPAIRKADAEAAATPVSLAASFDSRTSRKRNESPRSRAIEKTASSTAASLQKS